MIPQNERWKCDAHDDRIRQCTVILDWYDQLVNDAAFVYRIGVPVTNVTQLQFNHPVSEWRFSLVQELANLEQDCTGQRSLSVKGQTVTVDSLCRVCQKNQQDHKPTQPSHKIGIQIIAVDNDDWIQQQQQSTTDAS